MEFRLRTFHRFKLFFKLIILRYENPCLRLKPVKLCLVFFRKTNHFEESSYLLDATNRNR